MTTMPPPSWSTVLLMVLTQADLDLGFGPSWKGCNQTVERPAGPGDVACIDVGGLTRNRVVGVIEVDFKRRVVRLVAIDYDGGDDVDERSPPAWFWDRAAAVAWPVRP